jgi:hypothetical protein
MRLGLLARSYDRAIQKRRNSARKIAHTAREVLRMALGRPRMALGAFLIVAGSITRSTASSVNATRRRMSSSSDCSHGTSSRFCYTVAEHSLFVQPRARLSISLAKE